jgi:hypothetical protein
MDMIPWRCAIRVESGAILPKIVEFPLPFARARLRIMLTTWFRYLIESGGGMGPLMPQQPVAHPAMLVLTPPGYPGEIRSCDARLFFSIPSFDTSQLQEISKPKGERREPLGYTQPKGSLRSPLGLH